MTTEPTLALYDIVKTYESAHPVTVLRGVSLTIQPGEIVALMAPSGAGKSTLLHIAGLLDRPTTGDIFFQGQNTRDLTAQKRDALRGQKVGFVYQFHHLLPELNAYENASLPLRLQGKKDSEHLDALFMSLGIDHRRAHRPAALSGGERQRVAVARALALKPSLVLADEPTGSLDTAAGQTVFQALTTAARTLNTSVLFATHNTHLAQQADRCIFLQDGAINHTGSFS